MPSGMELMMKAIGINPAELMAEVQRHMTVIGAAVQSGEIKIAGIEQNMIAMNEKLDAILALLDAAPCARSTSFITETAPPRQPVPRLLVGGYSGQDE